MVRVALYMRVSTQEQADEGLSLPAQERALREYAQKHGYEIVAVYTDDGVSARTANRPAFQEMVKAAKKKLFDAILVHKFDRFSRNREDAVVFKNLLRRDCGVDVISITEPVDDSPIGKLMEGILETIAEFYSLNLAQESRKGMLERATQGRANGMAPLGYTVGEDGKLVVVPEEAEIVKWIFKEYIRGRGLRAIALALAQMPPVYRNYGGTRVPYKWSAQGVRVVLKNRAYLGEFVWNRRSASKGEPVVMRAEDDWIIVPGAHEPIVDRETWEQANAILRSRRRPRNKYGNYLLFGMVRCMDCGSTMSLHIMSGTGGKRFLRCNRYIHTAGCYFNWVYESVLEDYLWQFLLEIAKKRRDIDPSHVIPRVVHSDEAARLRRAIERCDEKFARQWEAYQAGVISLDELRKARENVEMEKAMLTRDLQRVTEMQSHSADTIRQLIQQSLSMIQDSSLPLEDRQAALRAIIDHIEYSKKQQRIVVWFTA